MKEIDELIEKYEERNEIEICHFGMDLIVLSKDVVVSDLKQLKASLQPVVPKEVAEWIEYVKKKGDRIRVYFAPFEFYGREYSKAQLWIDSNEEDFLKAIMFGYKVAKEKLYRVVFLKDSDYQEDDWILFKDDSDSNYFIDYEYNRADHRIKFTEQEIKSIDERYWQFAVEVEEEE